MKGLKKFVCNFWVQLSFFLLCIAAIILLHFLPKPEGSIWETIDNFISNSRVLSTIFVAVGTLILARLLFKYKVIAEEALKTEADHHKIVCKYKDYKPGELKVNENFFSEKGVYMALYNVRKDGKKPVNPYTDKYSDDYKAREEDIGLYRSGKLVLPSINIYANVLGNTRIKFDDVNEYVRLPDFLNVNTLELLQAHETSRFSNNVTVRLNDLDYKDGVLTLKTRRSQYFDMLMTNRCMDYKLTGGVTVRETYEAGTSVSLLKNSKLGNQIGINGLIFTKDGYILVEKRGRKKTVWKNKFAQPISLALKEGDLKEKVIGPDFADAESNLKKVILKTIKKNFGITENDITGFNLSDNFLGIARDLLEGGKPNMYFFVVVNMKSREFAAFVQNNMRLAAEHGKEKEPDKNLPSVSRDKLDSDFYLINYKDILVDYDYAVKVKARDVIRIKRKFYPRVSRGAARREGARYSLSKAFNGSIKRRCGEALLACMYYANVCGDRIKKELD